MEDNENNVTEPKEESNAVKTYTEAEVEEMRNQIKADYEKSFDDKFNKRWGREMSKQQRSQAKTNELLDLLKKETGKSNIDDLLELSYKQYGVEKPVTNSKDEEILGKYDAKEVLESNDYEFILDEVNRLADKDRTQREQAMFMELGGYLTNHNKEEKRKKQIKEAGIENEVLNDDKFKEFSNKFNEDTSIVDIYNLYKAVNPKEKPFSSGSLKDVKAKSSELFTKEEFMALTSEDLKNPKIFEKAMKSKKQFM